jgi:HNH endonuclease
MMESKMLTEKELKTRLNYNPETGHFTWLTVRGKKVKAGDRAGYEHKGYRHITLNDKDYAEHRLSWFYVRGEWPKGFIDHKNLDRSDNRWINLREVTPTESVHNRSTSLNNKTGFTGVRCQGKKFRARLNVGGARILLGDYESAEEASAAYEAARAELFGPRVHTKKDALTAIEKRIIRLQRQAGYKKRVYKTPKERFYENFKIDPLTGCWNWTGRIWDKTGYGVFKCKELHPRPQTASRASWLIHNGPIESSKIFVRHKCDNRLCVNPEHLELGVQKLNMEDCVKRGRINRGEDRPQAKLTEEIVRDMRRRRQNGESFRSLAIRYGVAINCAVSATLGKTWAHVDEPIPTIVIGPGRRKKE